MRERACVKERGAGDEWTRGEHAASTLAPASLNFPSPIFLILAALAWVSRRLSMRATQRLGSFLGDILFWGIGRYREVARRNLRASFEWEAPRVEAVARQVFRNIGKSLLEFVRLPALTEAELRSLCRLEGLEHLYAGLAAGRGVLIITGHYGNWELIAARLVLEGVRLSVVARDADDGATHRFINGLREGCGYRVIPRQSAPRAILEALRRNEVVAILIDQNTTQGGRFVPFFGRAAATATGPAVLALRTEAALLPGFCIRLPDDRHCGRLDPPVALPRGGDREAEVLELTAHLTRLIEGQVRADPTQWLWIHDRWRHRPPEERVGRPLVANGRG